jgi:hypothetical protein
MTILEDEFQDLDHTDIFGQPGYNIDSGSRRYKNLNITTANQTITCKAIIKYDVAPDHDMEMRLGSPSVKITDPYVAYIKIGHDAWEFNKNGEAEEFFEGRTLYSGVWRDWEEFDGGLSNRDLEIILGQIMDLFEAELMVVLDFENSFAGIQWQSSVW